MNKEQAIEQIKDIKEYIINPHQAEPQSMLFKQTQREKRLQALDIAIDSLDNEWVDVRDRLPSENKKYWVTTQYKDDKICTQDTEEMNYINGKWESEIPSQPVIAWKEYAIPKPYERKE